MDNTEEKDIKLDADKQAVALKTIKDVQFALHTLGESLKSENGAGEDSVRTILSLCGFHLSDLSKLTGVPTQTAAEVEQRHAEIRAANMRVHELERQLGEASPDDLIQPGITRLEQLLNRWWKYEGFGHISEVDFGRYGCKIKLSCSLFGDYFIVNSPTPVSDKERKKLWHAALREQGYILVNPRNGDDLAVEDCEQSRKTLTTLIKSRMPSASIRTFGNHSTRNGEMTMDYVELFVRDITDFATLPQNPTANNEYD